MHLTVEEQWSKLVFIILVLIKVIIVDDLICNGNHMLVLKQGSKFGDKS